jgi:hypothetical protein
VLLLISHYHRKQENEKSLLQQPQNTGDDVQTPVQFKAVDQHEGNEKSHVSTLSTLDGACACLPVRISFSGTLILQNRMLVHPEWKQTRQKSRCPLDYFPC